MTQGIVFKKAKGEAKWKAGFKYKKALRNSKKKK